MCSFGELKMFHNFLHILSSKLHSNRCIHYIINKYWENEDITICLFEKNSKWKISSRANQHVSLTTFFIKGRSYDNLEWVVHICKLKLVHSAMIDQRYCHRQFEAIQQQVILSPINVRTNAYNQKQRSACIRNTSAYISNSTGSETATRSKISNEYLCNTFWQGN